MTYLIALVLVMIALSIVVGGVLPLCSMLYGAWRNHRARRAAVEQEDTDKTLSYLAAARGDNGPRLTIVPAQRAPVDEDKHWQDTLADRPYDWKAGGL